MERFNKITKLGLIKKNGAQLGRAIFFAKLIIITGLLPIFSFQKVEGKMFSPLAYTLGLCFTGSADYHPYPGSGTDKYTVTEKYT